MARIRKNYVISSKIWRYFTIIYNNLLKKIFYFTIKIKKIAKIIDIISYEQGIVVATGKSSLHLWDLSFT